MFTTRLALKKFKVVAACSANRGIGYNNHLPWPHNSEDMKHFKISTYGGNIIMGRETFRSMGSKPLPDRNNIVLTRSPFRYTNFPGDNIRFTDSMDNALKMGEENPRPTYVIGGEKVFEESINHPKCEMINLTRFPGEYECDRFFPQLPPHYSLVTSKKSKKSDLVFEHYRNIHDHESQEGEYLKLLRDVITHGEDTINRTETKTRSSFGHSIKYKVTTTNPWEDDPKKLVYEIPLITTRQIFYRGAIGETLWMLGGHRDTSWLLDRGIKYWTGNSTRSYLDMVGLNHYPDGYLGPVYGSQWLRWNDAPDYFRSYTQQALWFARRLIMPTPINQIEHILDTLRKNPYDRRMVLTAWNPSMLEHMALPPCHMTYVFTVSDHGSYRPTLNVLVLMRSNDLFLGHPMNVVNATTLLVLMSRAVNMLPGEISFSIANAHIYHNHFNEVHEQLQRTPYVSPTLQIPHKIANLDDMLKLDISKGDNSFIIDNYYHHGILTGKMAV